MCCYLGSRTRGQADGFELDILPKLKDYKAKVSMLVPILLFWWLWNWHLFVSSFFISLFWWFLFLFDFKMLRILYMSFGMFCGKNASRIPEHAFFNTWSCNMYVIMKEMMLELTRLSFPCQTPVTSSRLGWSTLRTWRKSWLASSEILNVSQLELVKETNEI